MQDPYLQPGTTERDKNFNLRDARGWGRGRRTVTPPKTVMVYCPPCMAHFEAPATEDWWRARVELCAKHQKETKEANAN